MGLFIICGSCNLVWFNEFKVWSFCVVMYFFVENFVSFYMNCYDFDIILCVWGYIYIYIEKIVIFLEYRVWFLSLFKIINVIKVIIV